MKSIKVILSIILLLLVAVTVYVWLSIQNNQTQPDSSSIYFQADQIPTKHLIPEVEYFGQYLGTILSNQEPVAVKTILNYWDKGGVSDHTLNNLFETTDQDPKTGLNLGNIESFFNDNGLQAKALWLTDPKQLKSLIANNVPVYVQQKLSSEASPELYSTRIYIGYSDEDRVFIVHDNNFGNNFLIPYNEFDALSDEFAGFIMVTPKDYALSKKPNSPSADPSSYPPRLNIMDDPELRDLQIKIIQLNQYKREATLVNVDRVDESIVLLEEIVKHPAFDRLHPSARYSLTYNLTGFYMSERPNYERAIDILENITLPLQERYEFDQPYGEWDRKMDSSVYDAPYWTATPWARLGFLYLRIDNTEKADGAFKKALELIPSYPEALTGLDMIKQKDEV